MEREFSKKLTDILKNKNSSETLILEGARQVGKSYLINSVLQKIDIQSRSFDLEKESILRHKISATEDFDDFKALMQDQYGVKNNSILFFDEAQECRKIAQYVKSFKENWPEVKVILSGSSMNRFFDKTVRIPVGRYRSLFLQGFSFAEFLRYTAGDELVEFINSAPEKITLSRHKFLLEHYDKYLNVGGYPEAVKSYNRSEDYSRVILEIFSSLAEDFERKEEYQPALFEDIIRATANYLGSPSKLTQINAKKYLAQKSLKAMESWHLIHEVELHSFDPRHSSFLPKRYLHDVGFATLKRTFATPNLSIIDTVDPVMRTPLGGLMENALLIALLENEGANSRVGTWKKKSNSDIEVDFITILCGGSDRIPIECKAALKYKKNHAKNIYHYLNASGGKIGVVVSAAPLERTKNETGITIINIPIYLFTKENLGVYCTR